MSQGELADLLGVHVSVVSTLETGQRKPPAPLLLELSRLLGVDAGQLAEELGIPQLGLRLPREGEDFSWLRAWRMRARWTPRRLAEALGITYPVLHLLESGGYAPQEDLLARIAEVTGQEGAA